MSKPKTPDKPGAKLSESLDSVRRAWLKKIRPLLDAARQAGAQSGGASGPVASRTNNASVLQGDFVSRQVEQVLEQQGKNLQKSRDEVAKKFEENEANKSQQAPDDTWPALKFPKLEPPILDAGVELRENADHAKLPKDLKSKMESDVWHAIRAQQSSLIAIYIRLKSYGIWGEVKRVVGIKEQLPWHGQIGGIVFGVHGTGGIQFESHNPVSLMRSLVDTGHFGKDNKIMNYFHRKQTAYREWNTDQKVNPGVLEKSIHEWNPKDPYPPSSLHVSVGPDTLFDVHIDRVSPVNKPVEGNTVPNLPAGGRHWKEEVIGPAGRGVRPDIKVDKVPTGPSQTKNVPSVWVNFEAEWDTPGTNKYRKNPIENDKPARPDPPAAEIRANIEKKVAKAGIRFPITIGMTPDDEPDAQIVASDLALRILRAAQSNSNSIAVDVPNYLETKVEESDRRAVLNATEQIGKIARTEMGWKVDVVTRLTVTFGKGSKVKGETVSLN